MTIQQQSNRAFNAEAVFFYLSTKLCDGPRSQRFFIRLYFEMRATRLLLSGVNRPEKVPDLVYGKARSKDSSEDGLIVN